MNANMPMSSQEPRKRARKPAKAARTGDRATAKGRAAQWTEKKSISGMGTPDFVN